MTLTSLLFLYLAFRAKQLACDFILQTEWMALNKGKTGLEGYRPLFAHAGIHAAATLLIVLVVAPSFWMLSIIDFIVHAAIDRFKACLLRDLGWSYHHPAFWWAYGLDQEAHNLTHLVYVLLIFAAG